MKKIIFIVILLIISLFIYVNVNAEVIIPNNSIRVRVVPNSNSVLDQEMKEKVKKYISNYMTLKLHNITNVDEARDIISNSVDELNEDIKDIFADSNYNMDFKIKLGKNLFPDKIYKGVVYKKGLYESLVVYIGDAKGDNWWCVLFPPLCLLEADENDTGEVEYRSFIKDVIDKIL
mgnify:CR=1 FL=1